MARHSRSGVGLVVFVLLGVLVAVGLYGGDRYAHGRVERAVATQLQGELGTPRPPAVDITGWPFLTQVARQHLRSVHVVGDDVGNGGGSAVQVAHTDLVLTDVTSDDWFQTMTAGHVEGGALIGFDQLGALSSTPLRYAGGGKMAVELTTAAFGLDLGATITGTPLLDVPGQAITLGDPSISVGSVNIPTATAEALMRTLLRPIPVNGLPFGLRLSSLSAEDDGLHAGLVGDDVRLSR